MTHEEFTSIRPGDLVEVSPTGHLGLVTKIRGDIACPDGCTQFWVQWSDHLTGPIGFWDVADRPKVRMLPVRTGLTWSLHKAEAR